MQKEILVFVDNIAIYKNFIQNLPYNPALVSRAKKLRKAGVMSEVVFWRHVRNKSFLGIDFDRQRIIGNYIVDFYIKALGVVIEIDGSSHNEREVYDEKREDFLKSLGLKVYRISEPRVMHDLENTMNGLKNYVISEFS